MSLFNWWKCARELDQWTLGPRNNCRSKATNPHVHKILPARQFGKARQYYNLQPCLFITLAFEVIAYSNEVFGYHSTYLRLPLLTRGLLRELKASSTRPNARKSMKQVANRGNDQVRSLSGTRIHLYDKDVKCSTISTST